MGLGLAPDVFWSLTSREVAIIQQGAAARMRREHDELAWAVWHIAALPKAKKMPDLRKLQGNRSAQRVAKQDWRSQAAILASWG